MIMAFSVGESADLNKRLATLFLCASTKDQPGHMAGWRLGSLGLLERLELAPGDLRVSWCYAKSKGEAYRIEGTMLRMYYQHFGELPPLNHKFNWSSVEDV